MVEYMNDTCTLKPFLIHLFNKYSLISIPRVGEMISVELKRNCLVWTGIHVANVVQFARFPVKIYTSVSTVGHYCNKASGLGLRTTTCMRIAFATLFTAADLRRSLKACFILIQIISRTGSTADRLIMISPLLIYSRIQA